MNISIRQIINALVSGSTVVSSRQEVALTLKKVAMIQVDSTFAL